MAVNVLEQLQRQQEMASQQQESLSQRLARQDAFNSSVDPAIRAQALDFSNRPTLANPLDTIAGQLDLGERARSQRSAIAEDLGRVQSQSMDLLTKIGSEQQRRASAGGKRFSELEDLLGLRTKLVEQGLDTSTIDSQLSQLGFAPSNKTADPSEKLKDVNSKDRTRINDFSSFVQRLDNINSQLEDPGFFGGFKTGQTGPISKFLGEYGTGGNVRTNLEQLKADVRNQLFGAALTESEQQSANKILPGAGVQESANKRRIEGLLNTKINQLKTEMRGVGFSDEEINQYINNIAPSFGGSVGQSNIYKVGEYTVEEL